jgi:hypothetical protein
MTVRALALLTLLAGAATAAAQGTPGTKQATKAPATKTVAPQTKTVPPAQTKGVIAQPQRRPALNVAPENAAPSKPTVIMREVYEYENGGRRDPFLSLLTSTELRPTIADLKLVSVLFDESGRRPVAVMRDILSNTQYRVTTGMTLGRMRVTAIRRKTVIFTIEEFGLNRQDSLILGDTTKARAK